MKIEKVNENQIRCTLTREDLASRELKISEIAYGTEKAKTLFRDMMQQANFEFGFEAEDIPLMIEAIPLNAECIVLIITKVADPEELDTRFSRFAPSITDEDEDEEFGDEAFEAPSDEVLDLFRRLQSGRRTEEEKKEASGSSAEEKARDNTRTFRLDSLQQAISASRVIFRSYQGLSTLYKEESSNSYLLLMTQGASSKKDFDRACNTISEYGSLQRSPQAALAYLAEHCEALVAEHAVEALGKL